MPTAEVGQRVRVDMPQLQEPGAYVGGSVSVAGMITEVDTRRRTVTVRMDPMFGVSVTGTITIVDTATDTLTIALDEPVEDQTVVVVQTDRVALLM